MIGTRILEMRQKLGWSQSRLAKELDVNVKTIKNWENPRQTRYRISDAAWEYLDCATDIQAQQVAYARSVIEKHAEVFAESAVVVPITYYRDQAAYDKCGRHAGPYGQANATSRAIARELERMGIQVEFRYADSADA